MSDIFAGDILLYPRDVFLAFSNETVRDVIAIVRRLLYKALYRFNDSFCLPVTLLVLAWQIVMQLLSSYNDHVFYSHNYHAKFDNFLLI